VTRRLISVVLTLACHGALADDTPAPLKPGAGDNLASTSCSVCHTSDYIIMNSMFLTPDQWKAEVTKMRTVFGAPIDDVTAGKIIAYLAAQYAVTAKP
jgi:mono/diheme cytochrome c family protein